MSTYRKIRVMVRAAGVEGAKLRKAPKSYKKQMWALCTEAMALVQRRKIDSFNVTCEIDGVRCRVFVVGVEKGT